MLQKLQAAQPLTHLGICLICPLHCEVHALPHHSATVAHFCLVLRRQFTEERWRGGICSASAPKKS